LFGILCAAQLRKQRLLEALRSVDLQLKRAMEQDAHWHAVFMQECGKVHQQITKVDDAMTAWQAAWGSPVHISSAAAGLAGE
jgi:hypothetical protein